MINEAFASDSLSIDVAFASGQVSVCKCEPCRCEVCGCEPCRYELCRPEPFIVRCMDVVLPM